MSTKSNNRRSPTQLLPVQGERVKVRRGTKIDVVEILNVIWTRYSSRKCTIRDSRPQGEMDSEFIFEQASAGVDWCRNGELKRSPVHMKGNSPPLPTSALVPVPSSKYRLDIFHHSGVFLAESPHLPVSFAWPCRVLSTAEIAGLSEDDYAYVVQGKQGKSINFTEVVACRFLFPPPLRKRTKRQTHFLHDFSLEHVAIEKLHPLPLEGIPTWRSSDTADLNLRGYERTAYDTHFVPAIRLAHAFMQYTGPDSASNSCSEDTASYEDRVFCYPLEVLERPGFDGLREALRTPGFEQTLSLLLPPGEGRLVDQQAAKDERFKLADSQKRNFASMSSSTSTSRFHDKNLTGKRQETALKSDGSSKRQSGKRGRSPVPLTSTRASSDQRVDVDTLLDGFPFPSTAASSHHEKEGTFSSTALRDNVCHNSNVSFEKVDGNGVGGCGSNVTSTIASSSASAATLGQTSAAGPCGNLGQAETSSSTSQRRWSLPQALHAETKEEEDDEFYEEDEDDSGTASENENGGQVQASPATEDDEDDESTDKCVDEAVESISDTEIEYHRAARLSADGASRPQLHFFDSKDNLATEVVNHEGSCADLELSKAIPVPKAPDDMGGTGNGVGENEDTQKMQFAFAGQQTSSPHLGISCGEKHDPKTPGVDQARGSERIAGEESFVHNETKELSDSEDSGEEELIPLVNVPRRPPQREPMTVAMASTSLPSSFPPRESSSSSVPMSHMPLTALSISSATPHSLSSSGSNLRCDESISRAGNDFVSRVSREGGSVCSTGSACAPTTPMPQRPVLSTEKGAGRWDGQSRDDHDHATGKVVEPSSGFRMKESGTASNQIKRETSMEEDDSDGEPALIPLLNTSCRSIPAEAGEESTGKKEIEEGSSSAENMSESQLKDGLIDLPTTTPFCSTLENTWGGNRVEASNSRASDDLIDSRATSPAVESVDSDGTDEVTSCIDFGAAGSIQNSSGHSVVPSTLLAQLLPLTAALDGLNSTTNSSSSFAPPLTSLSAEAQLQVAEVEELLKQAESRTALILCEQPDASQVVADSQLHATKKAKNDGSKASPTPDPYDQQLVENMASKAGDPGILSQAMERQRRQSSFGHDQAVSGDSWTHSSSSSLRCPENGSQDDSYFPHHRVVSLPPNSFEWTSVLPRPRQLVLADGGVLTELEIKMDL